MDNTRYPATGHGYGSKFGDSDLTELSRRSGISKSKLQEALGTIKLYRLKDGLLQRSTLMRSTGSHEFLTVIPEGDWRAVEYGGATRRLSLRRHVIHTFHLTPMGPHRGRDKTFQAIMDAGCWWNRLYQDVQDYVRHCVICRSINDSPLVTGHQRSREYDGPFRYLLIDFVGPISPQSTRPPLHVHLLLCLEWLVLGVSY